MSYSHLSFLGTSYHRARGWFEFFVIPMCICCNMYLYTYCIILYVWNQQNTMYILKMTKMTQSPKFSVVQCRCMFEKQSLQMMFTNKLPNYSKTKKIYFRNSVSFFLMLTELNCQAWCVIFFRYWWIFYTLFLCCQFIVQY